MAVTNGQVQESDIKRSVRGASGEKARAQQRRQTTSRKRALNEPESARLRTSPPSSVVRGPSAAQVEPDLATFLQRRDAPSLEPPNYINRELSLLEFQARVLEE